MIKRILISMLVSAIVIAIILSILWFMRTHPIATGILFVIGIFALIARIAYGIIYED